MHCCWQGRVCTNYNQDTPRHILPQTCADACLAGPHSLQRLADLARHPCRKAHWGRRAETSARNEHSKARLSCIEELLHNCRCTCVLGPLGVDQSSPKNTDLTYIIKLSGPAHSPSTGLIIHTKKLFEQQGYQQNSFSTARQSLFKTGTTKLSPWLSTTNIRARNLLAIHLGP